MDWQSPRHMRGMARNVTLASLLASRSPGTTIALKPADREVTVTLGKNFKGSYTFHVAKENAIFKDWLRNQNGRPE